MSSQTLSPSLTSLIQRYNLDISVVDLKQVEGRLDAEFFKPEYLAGNSSILNNKFAFLSDLTEKIDVGFVGSMVSEYVEEGILLLQTQNVDEFFLKLENYKTINLAFHKKLKKSQVEKGNILIARSGSFGKASIYMKDDIINSSDIIIVQADESKINSFYLTAFINSKFGQNQLYRFASGGLQGHVNLTILESLKISLPSPDFQSSIASIVQEAHMQMELSKALYAEAEQILLRELGLIDWTPAEIGITEKMSEEVKLFGRCDAEFFQPKYDELIKKIKSYKGGYDTLENLISVISKQVKPDAAKEYQYCELADIDPSLGTVGEYTKILGKDLPSRARMQIEKGDVVVSSISGSSSKIALIQSKDTNLIASTGFFILKPKAFSAETNLVLMKSIFMQEFLVRSARGMILSATNQDDFKHLIIPNISADIQSLISSRIIDSHLAREKSKTLLTQAKRAVEIFIEEDEEKAKNYLNAL